MKMDWEQIRELLYLEVRKIIDRIKVGNAGVTDKQACDLKMLFSAIEKTYTIEMFEDEYENNFSGGYNRRSSRGRNYGVNYSRGYSGNGVNPNENYIYENSGHDEKEYFKSQLHAMIQTANDANTRSALQEALSNIR